MLNRIFYIFLFFKQINLIMNQVAVVKITKENGAENRRNIMIPQNMWNKIVDGTYKDGCTYELRRVTPIFNKPIEMIGEEAKEIELIDKAESTVSTKRIRKTKNVNDGKSISNK